MNMITEVGGTAPANQPAARIAERLTAGTTEQMVSLQNAQAAAQASGTPAAGAGSDATGSQADKDAALGRMAATVSPDSARPETTSADTQSVVQAQIAFLVAPPFDGEPSPQTIAEAKSTTERFQLLMEALGKRADAAAATAAKPAAAVSQEAGVSMVDPAGGLPV